MGDSGLKAVPRARRVTSDDSLSVRSMDSSRDEMLESYVDSDRPTKPACQVPPRLEGIKEGMRPEAITQFPNRRGLDGYATKVDTPSEESEELLQPDKDWLKQFAVVIRRNRYPHSDSFTSVLSVLVQSPILKAILSEQSAEDPQFNVTPSFPIDIVRPFSQIVRCWDAITKLANEHPDPQTRLHLTILCDVFSKEIEEPLDLIEDCRSTGWIDYNALWTIYKPGQLCYNKDQKGRGRLYKIVDAYYRVDDSLGKCFTIDHDYIAWDGERFGWETTFSNVCESWHGGHVLDLSTMPLDFHPDKEAIKARLLKQGQKYANLTRTEPKVFTGRTNEFDRIHGDVSHWSEFLQ